MSQDTASATTRRRFLASAGGTATVAALGGCLGLGGSSTDGSPDTVTFGTLPIATVAPVLIAEERGYFEERNIELQRERIGGVPLAVPQLASGQIDVAAGSFGASVVNSISQEVDIQIAADMAQHNPGIPGAARLWAREGLYTEGITVPELVDSVDGPLRVAHNAKGGSLDYVLGRTLQAHDLSWSAVEVSEIQFSNMIGALLSRDVDACIAPDPLGLAIRSNANAGHVMYASEVAPRMQIAAYFFGSPFVEDRSDVAVRWLEGYLLGVREYYDMGAYPDEEVATIVDDAFDIGAEAIRSSVPALPHKNGQVNMTDVMNQQAYHECRGYVDDPVDREAIRNTSLLSEALNHVGRIGSSDARPSKNLIERWSENAPRPYTPMGEVHQLEGFPGDSICQ